MIRLSSTYHNFVTSKIILVLTWIIVGFSTSYISELFTYDSQVSLVINLFMLYFVVVWGNNTNKLYRTYWNERELIFIKDGKEIRFMFKQIVSISLLFWLLPSVIEIEFHNEEKRYFIPKKSASKLIKELDRRRI